MKKRSDVHVLGAIVVALLVCFTVSRTDAAILLDRVVAVVNKEVITWSELYKMMESDAGDKLRTISETERLKVLKENEPIFLEKLIDFRLQIQDAGRIGMEVGPEEVKEAMDNIKKKYSMDDAAFEESLKKEGMSLEEYKKRLSEQILVSQYINRQVRNKIVVTDDLVKKHIETNRDIADTESFRLRQIFFRGPKDENEKQLLDEKVATAYRRLKAGENFSVVAGEMSEDATAKNGGDLGNVKKSVLAAEFLTVLESLKPGDVSNPFRTERGVHIVMLEGKTGAPSAAEVKETARRQLEEEQFMRRYKNLIKSLREKAHIEVRL
ncbi:MAG: peptidylprolyl isomerase [Nitrospirota bacterium]